MLISRLRIIIIIPKHIRSLHLHSNHLVKKFFRMFTIRKLYFRDQKNHRRFEKTLIFNISIYCNAFSKKLFSQLFFFYRCIHSFISCPILQKWSELKWESNAYSKSFILHILLEMHKNSLWFWFRHPL